MFCLGCSYELRGLPAGACPECGRSFDPSDPTTYRIMSRRPVTPRWFTIPMIGLSAWPLIWVGLVHLCLVAARLSLGRWPHRMGADDPKGLRGAASVLYELTAFSSLGMPLAFVAAVVVVLGLLVARRWVAAGVIAGAAVSSWVAAILLARIDPAQAIVWFFD